MKVGMKKNILLSIVVPIYNVENYLEDCLESIVEQGFQEEELEVICVDDGSNDDSLNIAKKYSIQYPYITVISKKNGGVASARNVGLKNATGKYIAFIDSDDFIVPRCYKQCIEIMESLNALSCSFPFVKVEEKVF